MAKSFRFSLMLDSMRSRDGGGESEDKRVPTVPPPLPRPSEPPVNREQQRASNQEERRREAEEDRGLIERAQKGDVVAFRALVERHQRRAFAIAYGLVRDENDARELVQDAFLRVYKALPTFQGGSSFFTWLYRIITNLSIDLMRKPGRQLTSELDPGRESEPAEPPDGEYPLLSKIDGSDPADVFRRKEMQERLREALLALPPYHRDVIIMREVDGMSYEEIAEAMGISKGTVMSRLFHARQKLQKHLASAYEEYVGARPAAAAADSESKDEAPKEAP